MIHHPSPTSSFDAGRRSSDTDVEKTSARSRGAGGMRESRHLSLGGRAGTESDGEKVDINAIPVPGARPAEELETDARGSRLFAVGVDDLSGSEEDGASEAMGQAPSGLARVVSRVVSRTSTVSTMWNLGPPPDGGARAWAVVASGHLIILNTWGFINSFGVFQAHYVELLGRSPSGVAWIGSMQVFLLFFIGTFTGRLTDAGYFRVVFPVGAVFQVLGIFTTAQCTQYWQFFLSQGVCMGLANGFLFCPTIAIVSTYFSSRRSLAIGVVACGSATGGLIFPSMIRQLLPTAGFAWSMRAIGLVQALGLVLAWIGLKPRVAPRKGGAVVDWASFRELEYTFYACGAFLSFWGVYLAFFYLAAFSRDVVGFSYIDSLNLLLVINGVGSFGRIVPNFFADRYGPINMFVLFAFLSGVSAICWVAVHDAAGVYAWAACYGTAAGGIQSLFPAGLASLTTDLRKAGVRLGMVFTIVSFATLTGPPIAGAIISRMGGSYAGAQIFAGCTLLIGCGFMAASRLVKSRKVDNGGVWAKV